MSWSDRRSWSAWVDRRPSPARLPAALPARGPLGSSERPEWSRLGTSDRSAGSDQGIAGPTPRPVDDSILGGRARGGGELALRPDDVDLPIEVVAVDSRGFVVERHVRAPSQSGH